VSIPLELNYDFAIEIRDALPDLNITNDQFDANTTLFADDCLPVRFFRVPRFTKDEITSVETGPQRTYIGEK
jgi:hypothetical protein